jgi:ribosome-associated toxin RatA of RatAB toxin-antitoxin module
VWTFHSLSEDACKVQPEPRVRGRQQADRRGLALGFQGLADRMVDDFCQAADRVTTEQPRRRGRRDDARCR